LDPSFIRTVATVTAAGAGVGVGVGVGLGGVVTAARAVAGALNRAGPVASGVVAGVVAAEALQAVTIPAAAKAIHSLRIVNSGSPALAATIRSLCQAP
jgi:hypothetical protein